MSRRRACLIAVVLAVLGPGVVEPSVAGGGTNAGVVPARSIARARFLMGSPLSIEILGGEVKEEAIAAAFSEVARLDAVLSNWRADSELSRLNGAAASAPFPCSSDLFGAVGAALRFAESTGGAFDPTVEAIVASLGLRGEEGRLPGTPTEASPQSGKAPGGDPPLEARARRALVGWRHVTIDSASRSVRFDRPGVGLDFGGIGKGIALDAAARVLREHGVGSALLNFGGQILAFGPGPAGDGWEVGIADPDDRARPIESVLLRDGSLSTSGQSERGRVSDRGFEGHILDPHTGSPAVFTGTVTVQAPNATAADALSTGLFVMGPERGIEWARSRRQDVVFLARDAHGELVRRGAGRFQTR